MISIGFLLLVKGLICTNPFLGSGPEGSDDLCFHTGETSPSSPSPLSSLSTPFEAHFPALRPKS